MHTQTKRWEIVKKWCALYTEDYSSNYNHELYIPMFVMSITVYKEKIAESYDV